MVLCSSIILITVREMERKGLGWDLQLQPKVVLWGRGCGNHLLLVDGEVRVSGGGVTCECHDGEKDGADDLHPYI